MPKVSVIIPVYNAERYLRECLDSVINQTLKDIEIICVDDGSTDDSLSILYEYQKLDGRISVLEQKNSFAGVARNNGIENASGEYLAFLDADDYFIEDALENLYMKASTYELDFIKGKFYFVNVNTNNVYETKYSKNTSVDSLLINKIVHFSEFPEQFIFVADVPWNGIYKRSFIDTYKIRFNSLRCVNDHSFFINCLILNSKFMVSDIYVAYYRVEQEGSLIGTKSKYYNCQIESYNIVKDLLNKYNIQDDLKHVILQREIDGVLGWYVKLSSQGNSGNIEEHLLNFLKTFDESDLGYSFLQNFEYRDVYYQLKRKLNSNNDMYDAEKVSIIIPVYNVENYLEECLTNVINQTYGNLEIICVDDASEDNSRNILEEFARRDERIRVIVHSKNKHQGGARNTGLDIATGKYIWFIDSDDYIDNDAVELLVDKMEALKDVDVLTFNAKAFIEKESGRDDSSIGAIRRNWPANRRIKLPNDAVALPQTIEGSSVTYFSKRDFICNMRFRENCVFEDADFSFRVFTSNATFYQMNYAPYHRRLTADSTTGNGASGKNEQCIIGRILAAKEILKTIKYKNLSSQHFAVVWFKRWVKWAIELYLQECTTRKEEVNHIIRELQMEYVLFSPDKVLANYKVFIPSIIVSFTSFPKRIATVHKVVHSMLRQTIMPDMISLYLAKEQFSRNELPSELLELENKHSCFAIKFCEDIKPHKKYFYAMQEYKDSIIITIDDDLEYDKNLVETLIKSYAKYPKAISCMRGHTIKMYDEYTFAPYIKWIEEKHLVDVPSILTLATGVGGVLYPPNCLPIETFNKNAIKKYSLMVDDLWLKWMALDRAIPYVLVKKNIQLNYIDNSQECSLWLENVRQRNNDRQWRVITEIYGWNDENAESIKAKLFEEYQTRILGNKIYIQPKTRNQYNNFILRKIHGGIRCYKEHGLKYTLGRMKEKLKNVLDKRK